MGSERPVFIIPPVLGRSVFGSQTGLVGMFEVI